MDGVRRTSSLKGNPEALLLAPRKNRPAPLSQNQIGSRIGLDGMRKISATPRELLGEIKPNKVRVPEVLPPSRSRRPIVAFSIIASALVVAGITGSQLIPAKAASESTLRQNAVAAIQSSSTGAPAKPVVPDNQLRLQALVETFAAANGPQYTIYVKDLKTGATALVNADKSVRSASFYKMFVAQRIYQKIDEGAYSYSQKAGSTSGRTIESCLNVMISVSDNPCGHDLGNKLGWSKQDTALKDSGYIGTTLGSSTNKPQMTSAKDMGLLFENLYRGTLMSPNSTEKFLAQLKNQRVNDRLPKGLPNGTAFAHKTGDLYGFTHDGGIVYGKKTDFVVIVMSGEWKSPERAKPAFGTLAAQLNNFFNN